MGITSRPASDSQLLGGIVPQYTYRDKFGHPEVEHN